MSLATRLQDLTTRIGTEFKAIRVLISGSGTGDISALTTTDKSSLVAAINEVDAATGTVADASTTVKGIIEIATLAEVTTGTDAVRAVTPQGVKQEIDAVKSEIMGPSVPGALDTLRELAAAVNDDASYAATITTALAGKQPLDADLTAFAALTSAADKVPYSTGAGAWAMADFTAAGRSVAGAANLAALQTYLSVYTQAQLGDPDTNLVTVFEAALV